MQVARDRSGAALPRTRAADVAATDGRLPSDEQLLAGVGAADQAAFELLYRRYARCVLGLALRRLGDRGRAEDAVQETFAKVWRSAVSYRSQRGRAAAWLYAVARNTIADGGRARHEPAAETPERAAPDAGPAERAEQGWLAWRVHRALAELPECERALIELAYWGGLSQREIAERLAIPLGTVKTRTRSALARLADALEEELR